MATVEKSPGKQSQHTCIALCHRLYDYSTIVYTSYVSVHVHFTIIMYCDNSPLQVHEKYANYTVSLLRNENKDTPTATPTNDTTPSVNPEVKGGGGGSPGSSKGSGNNNSKGSSPVHSAIAGNKKERVKPRKLSIKLVKLLMLIRYFVLIFTCTAICMLVLWKY